MDEKLTKKLASIGNQMVRQSNRATMAPVWLVGGGKFPRPFLTEESAEHYCREQWGLDEDGVIDQGLIAVACASDSWEMLLLMRTCFEAAGLSPENNAQVKNAYSVCWR